MVTEDDFPTFVPLHRHARSKIAIAAIPLKWLPKRQRKNTEVISKVDKWWKRGNCANVPIEDRDRIFFPVRYSVAPPLEELYEDAIEICAGCPVKRQCLKTAIVEEKTQAYGYRGGKNEFERMAIYRRYKLLLSTRKQTMRGNE